LGGGKRHQVPSEKDKYDHNNLAMRKKKIIANTLNKNEKKKGNGESSQSIIARERSPWLKESRGEGRQARKSDKDFQGAGRWWKGFSRLIQKKKKRDREEEPRIKKR